MRAKSICLPYLGLVLRLTKYRRLWQLRMISILKIYWITFYRNTADEFARENNISSVQNRFDGSIFSRKTPPWHIHVELIFLISISDQRNDSPSLSFSLCVCNLPSQLTSSLYDCIVTVLNESTWVINVFKSEACLLWFCTSWSMTASLI